MREIKNALAYEHFVFIDCSKYTLNNKYAFDKTPIEPIDQSGGFRGSFVRIDGSIYKLTGSGNEIYFELITVAELKKEKLRPEWIKMCLRRGECIGIIIYDNSISTHYEYTLPNEINNKIYIKRGEINDG